MPDVLHYQGPLLNVDRDHVYGPDRDRRVLRIRDVEYDADTDITSVTLRAILPDQYEEHMTPLIAGQRERERIRKVFGG